MAISFDPQTSSNTGAFRAFAVECTSEGVVNAAAPVHSIRAGPALDTLFSRFGVMGATLSVANTSANDDRSGSFSGALIHDHDNVRLGQLTTSTLSDLGGDRTKMGYTGEDGVVVFCPTPHCGAEQFIVRSASTSLPQGTRNEVNSLNSATHSITSTKSEHGDASGPWNAASGPATYGAGGLEVYDTDDMATGDPYGSFVFPNDVFQISITGEARIYVTDSTEVNMWAEAFDDSGDQIPIGDANSTENANRLHFVRARAQDAAKSDMYALSGRVVSTTVPIARIKLFVSAGTGTIQLNYANASLNFGEIDPRYSARKACVVVTGLSGTDSIAVGCNVSVAARLNAAQASLVSTQPIEFDYTEVTAAMQTTLNSLTSSPVVLGRNHPALAAAVTFEMLNALDGDEAFGWKSFKKYGKKALHAARRAAAVGEMLGVPGAELGGKGLDAVSAGIRHAKQAHHKLKAEHAQKLSDVDALISKAKAIKL